jgi:hypothetical protein
LSNLLHPGRMDYKYDHRMAACTLTQKLRQRT